jgi:eukaryotic-like serine/threonine-protein kinase
VSSDPPLRTASSGHRVGAYELATELERGALGPLFAGRVATGGEEGRLVAVRRIAIEACTRQEVERLVDAARTARRVRHSKLAAVLDVVATDREIAVVGEYFEGRSLGSLQRLASDKSSPIPPAVALRIGLEVLHGLRAVRETWKAIAPPGAGPAPRGGLSPDNVFVAAFGDVLLSEIGVSSVAGALAPFSELPAIVAYRSPEQLARDGGSSLDERSEVFSVGVMLWELMANRPLFGDTERLHSPPDNRNPALAERTRRDLQSKLIPPLGSLERTGAPIARAAVEIVERALRRDPATRFSGIDQMLGALLALNREFLASADQVQAAINPLVGDELAAQRAALGSASSVHPPPASGRRSDSNRPTVRPQPSVRAPASAVPRPALRDSFRPQIPAADHFSKHEAPTYPMVQPAPAKAQSASKQDAPSASRSLPLPRLPKPPGQHSRASSTPPPPAMRKSSTPPPPPVRKTSTPPPPIARSALQPTSPPPSALPASTPPPPAHTTPSAIPPAFGEPLPPLPELPDIQLPAVAGPATPPAPIAGPTPARESVAPAATAAGSFARQRARRIALVIGGAVGLLGLVALLRVLIRSDETVDSVAGPSSAERRASVSAPALPATEPVTGAPPAASTAVTAAASAPPGRRENQALAPTKPMQNVAPPPPAAPPRESDRRPEARPEPQRKPFRPKGI